MSDAPRCVMFFANGLAAVFDAEGRQLSRYQSGGHRETIRRLEGDGYDYRTLETLGEPDPGPEPEGPR